MATKKIQQKAGKMGKVKDWVEANRYMLNILSVLFGVGIILIVGGIWFITAIGGLTAWLFGLSIVCLGLWCAVIFTGILFNPAHIITIEAEKKELGIAQFWESWVPRIMHPGKHLEYNHFPIFFEIIKVSCTPRNEQFMVKDILCNTANTTGGLEDGLPAEDAAIPPGGGYIDATTDVTWAPCDTAEDLIGFIEIGKDAGVKTRLGNRIDSYTRSIARGADHMRMTTSPDPLARAMQKRIVVITRNGDKKAELKQLEKLHKANKLPQKTNLGIKIIEVRSTAVATGRLKEDNEGFAREQAQRSRDKADLQTATEMVKELADALVAAGAKRENLDHASLMDFVQVQMRKSGGFVVHANPEAAVMLTALARAGLNVGQPNQSGQQNRGGKKGKKNRNKPI